MLVINVWFIYLSGLSSVCGQTICGLCISYNGPVCFGTPVDVLEKKNYVFQCHKYGLGC